ncbi:MAG: hypothetical protein HY927_02015 [Elusimicrobia bacterium]|nr:hypothetical protein [Elusimicrobiota bacterium]
MNALPLGVLLALASPARAGCPEGMADVGSAFCIDRYEATVVERDTRQPVSPYYTPNPAKGYLGARWQFKRWADKPSSAGVDMPEFPEVERGPFEPMAVSKEGVYPQGFMNRAVAERACRNAGKRLCKRSEWYKACVGPDVRRPPDGHYAPRFPYGAKYEKGKCNYHVVPGHPLLLLGRSSSELDDPRLMLAQNNGMRLLAKTGAFAECTNGYGVYDMVGNQDEVVDDKAGDNMIFVGSFYSRAQGAQPDGCASAISAHHASGYIDYSIGFRCCADP